MTSDELWPILH